MVFPVPITIQEHSTGRMTDIYEKIYQDLKHIGVLEIREYAVIRNDPDPPLYIDRIGPDRYAIAHNRIEDGQVVTDMDMEIQVYPDRRIAEPLTFQDSTTRKVAYPEPGRVDLKIKNELTVFLERWLTSLIKSGYRHE
jgi:hypothetical protein